MAKDKKKLPKVKPEGKNPLAQKGKHPLPESGPKFQMRNQKAVNSATMRRGNSRGR
jgi:hypothetical protein